MAISNYCLILEDKWVLFEMEMALPLFLSSSLSLNNFLPANLKYTHQKHISYNYSFSQSFVKYVLNVRVYSCDKCDRIM